MHKAITLSGEELADLMKIERPNQEALEQMVAAFQFMADFVEAIDQSWRFPEFKAHLRVYKKLLEKQQN
jgi:hypothetical protein